MANPLLSYGWTPDSAVAASGGLSGGTNTAALPNSGAQLAWGQNLTRAYPSWMNPYGYQGSMANNAEKQFAAPGVDPYSLLPSHAADGAQSTAPETAPQTAAGGRDFQGPEMNAEGGHGTGGFPSFGDLANIPGQFAGGMRDFAGAIGGALGGGSPGGMSADQGDITSEARGMFRGGMVTRNRLTGPNPAGPDDGYAPLDIGEGVLTAKAIRHYGADIVSRLNKLAVPKSALR